MGERKYKPIFVLHINHSSPFLSSSLTPTSVQPTPIHSSKKIRSLWWGVNKTRHNKLMQYQNPSLCIKVEQGISPYGMGSKNSSHVPGIDPLLGSPKQSSLNDCCPHAAALVRSQVPFRLPSCWFSVSDLLWVQASCIYGFPSYALEPPCS